MTFHEKMGGKCRTAVGAVTPYALQHLLDRAKWDCDEVRDVLRVYVWQTLASPDAVLVIDETADLEKGTQIGGGATPVQWYSWTHRELL